MLAHVHHGKGQDDQNRIATGEEADDDDVGADVGKDPAAVSLGKRGGKARAEALSKKERADIAKKAAAARWKKEG